MPGDDPTSPRIQFFDGEWTNDGDDVTGFSVTEGVGDYAWSVFVAVAEFVRDDPLEVRLRSEIDRTLRSVAGVEAVEEEDREVWLVAGACGGEQLAVALDVTLRTLESDLRRYYDDT